MNHCFRHLLRVGNHADILVLGVILYQRKIFALGAFWNSVDADDIQVVIQVTSPGREQIPPQKTYRHHVMIIVEFVFYSV